MKRVSVEEIDFGKGGGLVPVVARDSATGRVLMLAYANRQAVDETAKTGFAHYFSRSRGKLWKKGEESGHVQRIRQVRVDCDRDTLLYDVDQSGPACHTGEETCFFTGLQEMEENDYDSAMAAAVIEMLRGGSVARRRWARDGSRTRYDYLVNPVIGGIPPPPPEVLEWIVGRLDDAAEHSDKVVAFEGAGTVLGALLAQRRKEPLSVIRKGDIHAPSRLSTEFRYSSSSERGRAFVYGLTRGERVVLVDDVVSTGGSLTAAIGAIRKKGVVVTEALCAAERLDHGGGKAVEEKTGVPVKTLFGVRVVRRKVEALATPLLSRVLGT